MFELSLADVDDKRIYHECIEETKHNIDRR